MKRPTVSSGRRVRGSQKNSCYIRIINYLTMSDLSSHTETFEKRSISFKIKAHEDFNHRNILHISRIKIQMQRRDWAKGGVLQRSHTICVGFSFYWLWPAFSWPSSFSYLFSLAQLPIFRPCLRPDPYADHLTQLRRLSEDSNFEVCAYLFKIKEYLKK